MHYGQNLPRRILISAMVLMLTLVARASQAQNITLQWDPNTEADVAGYWVYIGNAPGSYTSTVDVGNVTTYTFNGGGQRYCFAIAAYAPGPTVGDKSVDVCTEGNQPPTLFSPGNQTSAAGTAVSLNLQGSDPEGAPVTFSATGLPPGLTLTTSTGAIGGTPTTAGTYTVTVTASDGTLTASVTFTWTIQSAVPGVATPLNPTGSISTATPSFEWESVSTATSYRLWVDDASTTDPKIQVDYTPAQAGCTTSGAVCRVSPGVALAAGRASWSVRASNAAGAGPWSGALDFMVPDGKIPSIVIATPTAATTYSTGNGTIALGGTASDDIAVTQVTWTNDRGGSGTASGTSSWTIPSIALSAGVNVITVTARDGAGNSGTDVLTVTRTDGQSPTVDLTVPTTGSAYTTTTSSISLGGTATDDIGVTAITWSSDRGGSGNASIMTNMASSGGATTWSISSVALQPGVNNITVNAFDAVGNQSSKVLAVTLADVVAPTVSISTPSPSTTSNTVTLTGVAYDLGGVTQVTWSNNQGGSGTASGTTTWSASVALKPGANVITVTAKDAAGNAGSAVVTVTMTDGTAPTISIATPTAATTFSTTAATLALGGTASDAFGVTDVSWSTDKGASGVASGTTAWTVASIPLEGVSTVITGRARDAAGLIGTDVLTVTRTDGVPPAVDITSPAAGATFSTTSATVALAGSASDNVGVSQVSWSNSKGGSGVAAGTTSWSIASVSLQPGANVITVTAKDVAGNVATDVLTITLTDAVAPSIAITSPSAKTLTTTAATLTLGGTASDVFGVTEVRWSNDRGGSGVASGTTSWSVQGLPLQSGTNTITVTASDAAGNTSSDHITVTSDSKAPTTLIASPAADGSYVTKGETVSLAGTASDEVGVTEVVWANNRGGSGVASGKTNWTIANVALQPGVNVITVTARDAAGNTGNATLSVTRDSQGPTVAIVLPTTAPTLVTNKGSVVLSGKAADNSSVKQVTWQNSRGGQGTAAGTSDWSVASVALQAGANVISVTASDAAGNTATSTITVTLDTRAPSISLQAPTSGNVYQTTANTVALGGIAADDTGVVEVTWANAQGASGAASGTTSWTAAGVRLVVGFNDITVTAKDAAGNTATANLKVKATDKTAPEIRITGPSMDPAVSVGVATINLEGTASDDFDLAQIAWANNRGGSGMTRAAARWVVGGVVLQPGVNVIAVTAVDASGNSSSDEIRITFDRGAPTVSITAPTSAATYTTAASTVTVAGVASDDEGIAQVTWTTDKGQSGVASGTTAWSIPSVNVDASTVLTVTATDKSGNSTRALLTLVRGDASAPVIKIYTPTTAPSYSTTASSVVLGGTASDDRGIAQVAWSNSAGGGGVAFGTTGWSTPSVPLVVGVNVITVTVKDAAGNSATATTSVTRSESNPNPMGNPPPSGSTSGATIPTQNPMGAPAPSVVETQSASVTQAPAPPRGSVSMPPPAMPSAPAMNPAPTTLSKASDLRTEAPAPKTNEQAPPVVRILSPTSAAQLTTTSATIGMSGTAAHAGGIAVVKWSTDRGDSGVAEGTSRWNIPSVRVRAGVTTVTITAVSVAGDSATAVLTVKRPDELPKLTVVSPTADSQWTSDVGTVALKGSATDNVTRVTWSADSGATGLADGTTSWSISAIVLQPGLNKVMLTAQDGTGRTDRHVLTITYRPRVSTAGAGSPLLSRAGLE